MVKLIWMACLMVLSLEVTNSWKYDRRELKDLMMMMIGQIYRSLSLKTFINNVKTRSHYHKN